MKGLRTVGGLEQMCKQMKPEGNVSQDWLSYATVTNIPQNSVAQTDDIDFLLVRHALWICNDAVSPPLHSTALAEQSSATGKVSEDVGKSTEHGESHTSAQMLPPGSPSHRFLGHHQVA